MGAVGFRSANPHPPLSLFLLLPLLGFLFLFCFSLGWILASWVRVLVLGPVRVAGFRFIIFLLPSRGLFAVACSMRSEIPPLFISVAKVSPLVLPRSWMHFAFLFGFCSFRGFSSVEFPGLLGNQARVSRLVFPLGFLARPFAWQCWLGKIVKEIIFLQIFFSSLHFLPRRLERPTPAGKERGHIVSCFSMLLLPLSRFVVP